MTISRNQVGEKRAITIEDLLAWKIANDPQMAPDGSRIVYLQKKARRDYQLMQVAVTRP